MRTRKGGKEWGFSLHTPTLSLGYVASLDKAADQLKEIGRQLHITLAKNKSALMPFRQAVSCSGANLPLEIPLRCNRFPVYLWVLCIKTCLPDPHDNVCLGSHLSPVNHRWLFSLLNTPSYTHAVMRRGVGRKNWREGRMDEWMHMNMNI